MTCPPSPKPPQSEGRMNDAAAVTRQIDALLKALQEQAALIVTVAAIANAKRSPKQS